jgi:Dihydrofolate reductase
MLVNSLKQKNGKDIWICGGSDIVHQLMQNNLIDKYHISVIPTILGNGIRLFDVINRKTDLQLITSKSSNGIVELVYQKR